MKLPQTVGWAVERSPLGWVGLCASPRGISRVILPQPSETLTAGILAQHSGEECARDQAALSPWLAELARMLSGEPVDCSGWTLDLRGATPFQQRVWSATRQIPWGQTRSYWWVAVRAGDPRAVRAVGQAMGANPLPLVVPCHRVVRESGALGGYGGGVDLKRRLLEIEGVKFTPRGSVA